MRKVFIPEHFDAEQKLSAELTLDTVPGVVIKSAFGPMPTPLTADRMVPLFHCCGRLAFYYQHYPQDGEMLEPEYARYIDGRRVDPKVPPHCGTCGERIIDGRELKPACLQCGQLRETCGGNHANAS